MKHKVGPGPFQEQIQRMPPVKRFFMEILRDLGMWAVMGLLLVGLVLVLMAAAWLLQAFNGGGGPVM